MNDSLEYARMIEMPVESSEVIIKTARKKKRSQAKKLVMDKVNSSQEQVKTEEVKTSETLASNVENAENSTVKVVNASDQTAKKTVKKKFKFDVLYAEGLAIFILVAGILLTNIFWENSGMNTLFKDVFGTITSNQKIDERSHMSFNATTPSKEMGVSVSDGVMTFSGKGSIYPVCDGKVSEVLCENGKYTITINHSKVFKTVISGIDYVYVDKGEAVFKNIPVCYLNSGEAQVLMYDNGILLKNYIVENGQIIWEN